MKLSCCMLLQFRRMETPVKEYITLFCIGCFNPVTNKHLRMMELARDALHRTGKFKVERGLISPAHDGYGKEGLLPSNHRIAMLKLAVQSNPWLSVDTWETEQEGYTTTAPTLDSIRDRLHTQVTTASKSRSEKDEPRPKRKRKSDSTDAVNVSADHIASSSDPSTVSRVMLVCGADLLESFKVPGLWSPRDMEHIVRDYGIVVISRGGSDPHHLVYENDTLTKYSYNIYIVNDWIGDDFSSTKVRRAIRRNESVKYVIQDSVIDYIKEHELYNPNYAPGDTDQRKHVRLRCVLCCMQVKNGAYNFHLNPQNYTLVQLQHYLCCVHCASSCLNWLPFSLKCSSVTLEYMLNTSHISSGYFSMENSLTLSQSVAPPTTHHTADTSQCNRPNHLSLHNGEDMPVIVPPPKQFERMSSQSMQNLSVPTSSRTSSQRSSLSACSNCRSVHTVTRSTSQDLHFKYICDNSCYMAAGESPVSADISPSHNQFLQPLSKSSSYNTALQVMEITISGETKPNDNTSYRQRFLSAIIRHMPTRCGRMKRSKKSSTPLVHSPSGL